MNNMKFIEYTASTNKKPVVYTKIKRYLLEAEDFYFAYTMLEPRMPELYKGLRILYEQLRSYYLEQTLSLPQLSRYERVIIILYLLLRPKIQSSSALFLLRIHVSLVQKPFKGYLWVTKNACQYHH